MFDLKNIKYIHMLGICGTGMGSLACLLKEAGYKVTGSDENVYPPMSTQLEQAGIQTFQGYKPENLAQQRPDIVIIGNVISRGNPEGESVISSGIKYLSMPQAVAELFIKDKHSIVIAGTHGKTTTSTLCAWLIEKSGKSPSFLIGGVGQNFGSSARIGSSDYFVIEGDEYDTAFFDKGPKFLHYRPKSLILTPVEFDHADIYRDLDHVLSSFRKLIDIMPKDGLVCACTDSQNVAGLIKNAKCKVVTYGFSDVADYVPKNIVDKQAGSSFDIFHKGEKIGNFDAPFYGKHNIQNAAGVIALLCELHFPIDRISQGLETFRGIKRRQEIRGRANGVTVIDDFAHHPTAIRETIQSVRSHYSNGRLISVFEPRSNTSRRNIFQHEFAKSFAGTDIAVIANVHRADKLEESERLDIKLLIDEMNSLGFRAFHFDTTEKIVEFVAKEAKKEDVVLIMSNGGFDNIHERLLIKLKTNV